MDSFTVPEDLAQARRAWRATYQALAATSRPADNTRLRQQAGSPGRAGEA
ncbi:hypothetical protein [Streptomyces sp. NPDC006638]